MKSRPECLLYTQDPALAQRLERTLASVTVLRHAGSPERFDAAIAGGGAAVLLLDLRAAGALERLPALVKADPPVTIVALGAARSEPVREAEALGVFGVEELEGDWRRLQQTAARALDRAELGQQIRILRADAARAPVPRTADPLRAHGRVPVAFSLDHFSAALRNITNVEALLQNIVDGIAHNATVSRVGLFAQVRSGPYRLRAERNCLEETRALQYPAGDPLVRWLELHAHVLSRAALEHLAGGQERLLLERTLDAAGAEVLVPLFARGRLLGWFFAGHRTAGFPFGYADLEDLAALAEHVSTTIENALLYEEIALQKSLAETLLHAIPTGIVAAGEDGTIRWFNAAAESLLGIRADEALGSPVEKAGSLPADLLRRALRSPSADLPPVEWTEGRTGRTLCGSVRRLVDGAACVGAMALIENVTEQRRLVEKEEQLERSKFWTDLAAAMAHEIRNPLVAIQTFAQLLPSRYQDPEFREEFSREVTGEVARLNRIVDDISGFAHPPVPAPQELDVPVLLRRAVETARARCPHVAATVDVRLRAPLPRAVGDPASLSDSLAHLVVNALEALATGRPGQVTVSADVVRDHPRGAMLRMTVADNGRGIPPEIKEKIFSPFCTTKARGLGLGLPIVRRTVLDHNGEIQLDTSHEGTRVDLLLPLPPEPAAE